MRLLWRRHCLPEGNTGSQRRHFDGGWGYRVCQLAVLRLLLHLTLFYKVKPLLFYKVKPLCRFLFLLNNQGRLTRTCQFINHPTPSPRTYLSADFDFDMQIRETLTQLNIRTSDEHILSHQADDPTSLRGDPVPWKTQLNSRCDALATHHLQQQTQPTLLVPFLPASGVTLTIQNRTITSKLPAQLRHIGGSSLPYTNKKLQVRHMCRIHNWTPAQFHSVDWTSFHAVTNIKSNFPNRLFLIRWVNHILPFHHRQFRFQLSPSPNCPSESESHLLRCPHPDRKALHKTSLNKIRAISRQHPDPFLHLVHLRLGHHLQPALAYDPIPRLDQGTSGTGGLVDVTTL
jgi:hypothetical protein